MPNDRVMTPEERVAFNAHLHNVATQEAVVRSLESRVTVLGAKANREDRYREHADTAMGELEEAQAKLEELNEQTDTWGRDLEGTRNTLSDVFGNYAKNARVANVGGIGITGSNSDIDSGEAVDDPDEAGSDPAPGVTPLIGRGGRAEDARGRPLLPPEDDDEEDTSGTAEDPERDPQNTRPRKGRARAKARGRRRREPAEASEE